MSTTPTVVPHPKQTSPVFGILLPLPGSSVKSILPLVCGQLYAIGRDMKVCDVGDADNPYMSRIHLYVGTSLVLGQWRAWIKDTNSTNGVWVNGHQIAPDVETPLVRSDQVELPNGVESGPILYTLHVYNPDTFLALYDKLTTKLGSGTFGVVTKCRHRATGVVRAVKVIAHPSDSERLLARREGEFALSLSHENIVKTIGVFHSRNTTHIVMELAPFHTLSDFAQGFPSPPIDKPVARDITLQLTRAVSYMHSKGVMHRDLKPGNILIMRKDPVHIKVTDFGLTRWVDNNCISCVGTYVYTAPEVFIGKRYTEKADCFSLGCIIFELLAGFLPFSTNSLQLSPLVDNRFWPRYDHAARGTFCDSVRQIIDGLIRRKVTARLGANDVLTSGWLQGARRRALIRSVAE